MSARKRVAHVAPAPVPLRAEVVNVTPELGKHLRTTAHFERQRPINDRNVDRLAMEMKRGWFVTGTAIYICVLPDGTMQIVNGNHTLEAVAASGVTVPLTFIYSQVPDIAEAARVYSCMDLQKVRTWSNSLQAVGLGADVPMATSVVAALGVIMAGFKTNQSDTEASQSRTARLAKLKDYTVPAQLIGAAFHGAPSRNQRMLCRASVLAVALQTAKDQPAAAVEFWRACASDDGLKKGDPAKALLSYLTNNPAVGTNNRAVQARAAALAWNAFFDKRPLEYCKPLASLEFRLRGTAYHAGVADAVAKAEQPPASAPKPKQASLMETGVLLSATGAAPTSRFVG